MKRTFGIIAALILALCLCACTKSGESTTQPTEAQPSSTQDLSVYEKSEGLLSQEVWYNENGLKFSTVKYEYDAAGRLVKETTLGINGGRLSKTVGRFWSSLCVVSSPTGL